MRGDCLSCSRLSFCQETDVEKVLKSYTCVLFEAVLEPVFYARVVMMQGYGEVAAIEAMLNRPPPLEKEGEEG